MVSVTIQRPTGELVTQTVEGQLIAYDHQGPNLTLSYRRPSGEVFTETGIGKLVAYDHDAERNQPPMTLLPPGVTPIIGNVVTATITGGPILLSGGDLQSRLDELAANDTDAAAQLRAAALGACTTCTSPFPVGNEIAKTSLNAVAAATAPDSLFEFNVAKFDGFTLALGALAVWFLFFKKK